MAVWSSTLPADKYEVLKNSWVESLQIFENNYNGGLLVLISDWRTTLFSRSVCFLKHKKEQMKFKCFEPIKLMYNLCFIVPPLCLYCTNHRVCPGSNARSCGAERSSARLPPHPHHQQPQQCPSTSPRPSSSNASMLKR